MNHTDDVLAEIVAANELVCQTRSAMNLAKAEASARSKAYAEAVDNLTLTIGGAGRESATPLFDQAEPDHQVHPVGTEKPPEPGETEPPEADQAEPVRDRRCTRGRKTGRKPKGEPDYFPPFKDGEPAIRSETLADQEVYDQVKPRPRGRKTGRKVTKKRSKTRRN